MIWIWVDQATLSKKAYPKVATQSFDQVTLPDQGIIMTFLLMMFQNTS